MDAIDGYLVVLPALLLIGLAMTRRLGLRWGGNLPALVTAVIGFQALLSGLYLVTLLKLHHEDQRFEPLSQEWTSWQS